MTRTPLDRMRSKAENRDVSKPKRAPDRYNVTEYLDDLDGCYYTVSDGLLIVTLEGDSEIHPLVENAADATGWERDTDHLTDGEYDPEEHCTAFAFRPA